MNIDLLKNALIAYKESHATVEEDVNKCLAELNDVKHRLSDVWKGECYVVSPDLVHDTVIERTYDTYTDLYVKNNYTQPSYEDFYNLCRERGRFNDILTDDMLEVGFELVAILFEDNIRYGHHDKNGMPL